MSRPAERIPDAPGAELLLPIRAAGAAPPLFCVHPISGLSWCYAGLLRYVADRPIYGLQARGATAPDRLPADLAELVDDYLARLRAIQPAGPYHLLGWSAGGSIAHAMACRLQRAGEQVAFLALLDSYPSRGTAPAEDPARLRREIAATIAADLGVDADPADADLADADPAGATDLLLRELGRRSRLGAEQFVRLVDVAVHSRRIVAAAAPGRYRGDALFLLAGLGRPPDWPGAAAWSRNVSGELREHRIACRHAAMMRPAPLAEIGPIVAAELARATAPGAAG